MATIMLAALQMVSLAIVARALLSWLPISPSSRWATVQSGLRRLTDPILQPIRSLLPRTGAIDLSPMVAILAISVVLTPIVRML